MTEHDESKANAEVPMEPATVSRRAIVMQSIGLLALAGYALPTEPRPKRETPIGETKQGLGPTSLPYVGNIATLRTTLTTTVGPAVLVLGYHVEGDGGGGLFVWDAASVATDDGGVVIQVTSVSVGRWVREIQGPLSVKWFGAKGDGTTNDRAAIQAALDYRNAGLTDVWPNSNTVFVPSGEYLVSAPSNQPGLTIIANGACLVGAGAGVNASLILFDGPGAGLLIEGSGCPQPPPRDCQDVPPSFPVLARGAQVRNLSFYPKTGGTPARDAIVVHAPFVTIADCVITAASRHGILIESRTPGTAPIGLTTVSAGNTINSNYWRLFHVNIHSCGNISSQGDSAQGAGVYIHGNDANAGCAIGVAVQSSNVGIHDQALGATWLMCYNEGNKCGFRNPANSGASLYLGCSGEDFPVIADFKNLSSIVVGGGLLANSDAAARVGAFYSRLHYRQDQEPLGGVPGAAPQASYEVQIPGYLKSAIDFARTPGPGIKTGNTSAWCFGYEPTTPHGSHAHSSQSWRWVCRENVGSSVQVSEIEPYATPFGWTERGHARGGALPFIAAPLLNTVRRWSYRQYRVTLAPGKNIIYLHGGTTNAGPTEYAQDPAIWWPKARTHLTITLEMGPTALGPGGIGDGDAMNVSPASVSTVLAPDVRVGGYCFTQESGGRNVAASFYNAESTSVLLNIIWHFEAYVPAGNPFTELGVPLHW